MVVRDKTVLIIDDDNRNTFALSAYLKSKGFRALSAGGMNDAFEKLATNKNIDVILLDMMMPEMDGYEALEILKSNQEYSSVPVIAVTAQAMAGDREKCLAAGADEYVSKPVDVDFLLERLKHIV
ncbi:MAG TPA: response regulator [Flavitalea sp.]|nr:response regulator [Flavitalea sp.]